MKKTLNWIKSTFGNSWLAKAVERLFQSLDNTKLGYSAKKLTAFAIMCCVVILHIRYSNYAINNKDFSLFPTILGTDFATVLALYGINEYSKNKGAQREAKDSNPEEEQTKA